MPSPPRSTRLDHRPTEGTSLQVKAYEIVFESDTPAGKAFDVVLIALILASVVVVMLESVAGYRLAYGPLLRGLEWVFTVLFTIEYVVRLWAVRRTWRYVRSFFGVIDLLSILPTYASVLIPGFQALSVVRALRVLRVFRVLKLAHHVQELEELLLALRRSARKISVFVFAVLILVVVFGSLMYVIEGAESGFTSAPRGVYWAIVTLTTVGYGDISPESPFGQAVAAFIMILGYGTIAVPTGIVSVELAQARGVSGQSCSVCHLEGHHVEASYCRRCGASLRGVQV